MAASRARAQSAESPQDARIRPVSVNDSQRLPMGCSQVNRGANRIPAGGADVRLGWADVPLQRVASRSRHSLAPTLARVNRSRRFCVFICGPREGPWRLIAS
jgi:hypothetical protein